MDQKKSAVKYEILLVEDNLVNQEVALAMLLSRGCNVNVANNGAEAITMLGERCYDIVLMDIQMPVMNGYEAAVKIREMEKVTGKHVYIIGVTANIAKDSREKCIQAGMDDFINKPLYIKNLMTVIEKVNEIKVQSAESKNSPPAGNKPSVDLEQLLDKLGNNHKQIARCLSIFEEDTPKLLESLKAGIKTKNPREAKNATHGLRGMLLTMEMHKAAQIAAVTENLALGKNFAEADAHVAILEKEIDRAVALIRSIVSGA